MLCKRRLAFVASFLTLGAACGKPVTPAAARPVFSVDQVTAFVTTGYRRVLDNPRLATVTFRSYYQWLLSATDDRVFTIGGRAGHGARSALIAAAPTFVALDQRFPNIGSFLNHAVPPNFAAASATLDASVLDLLTPPPAVLAGAAPAGWTRQAATVPSELAGTPAELRNVAALAAAHFARKAGAAALDLVTSAILNPSVAPAPRNSVVRIKIVKQNGRISSGSAFVNNGRLITAGHCVQNAQSVSVEDSSGDYIPATSWQVNPAYDGTQGTGQYDVAKVYLPDGSISQDGSQINYDPVDSGSQVNVFGYGSGDSLQWGSNTARNWDPNGLLTLSVPAGSAAQQGDSGGPVTDSCGDVVAINHAIGFSSSGDPLVSVHARASENQDFLSSP